MSVTPLRIGMFGGGTVGGGVYEILLRKAGFASRPVVISHICVRSLDKPRDFEIDPSVTTLTTDPDVILKDESIDCVIEVMGGTTLAKKVVQQSLQHNKAVVTANKALVAECFDELHATKHNQTLCYEAAVCGGIPIIQLVQSCYAGDTIREIAGIANGTTNYMLSKMEAEGVAYDAVLKEAQDLGYAEADPTADVEGHDVRAKIAILAKLAFGQTLVVEQIPCKGISAIQEVDFANAKALGCTIKLIGKAQLLNDNQVSVYVSPMLLPLTHLLASAKGSGNAIAVTSDNMGLCTYTGPGAGRFPTANSIVADVVRVANGTTCCSSIPSASLELLTDYEASFYIRTSSEAVPGIAMDLVSEGYCVTKPCKYSEVQAATSAFFMPLQKD